MAVMLTQWSPVPWSGETVSHPSLPPPAEGAVPTPIYETLVREWSRAGRTVPGQTRPERGEAEGSRGRHWQRTDTPAHAPPAAPAPTSAPANWPVDGGGTYGGGAYGSSVSPYGSTVTAEGSNAPYGGECDPTDGCGGQGEGFTSVAEAGRAAPAGDAGAEAGAAANAPEAGDAAPRPPAWERVAIL